MKKIKNKEIKVIFALVSLIFLFFLIVPSVRLLIKSVWSDTGFTTAFYREVCGSRGFLKAVTNSLWVSCVSAAITTLIAFLMAYTIHYTNTNKYLKKFIQVVAVLPMLLPTITYGFAIIYSFGKEGLLTRLCGRQLFTIYGFNGLTLGYVIYTLPISFMLIFNAMGYIDKKYMVVSRIMGDKPFATFRITVLRPLWGTLAASFIQSFFLSFTDFGIPAAVGGNYEVIASVLYNEMLGSVPNFNNGSVVAMIMLVPSIISIAILQYLERYNIRYNKISAIELPNSRGRDWVCGIISTALCLAVLSIFAVIFVVPFVNEWPYDLQFTWKNIQSVLQDTELSNVYVNSLMVAFLTAVFGTLVSYGSALVTARSQLSKRVKKVIEQIALITNTIPGMVLGLAFLFSFTGTSLQNTFLILIICNVVHYFATPYLMMKESLAKMNSSWETTAMLMGDSWLKTIIRVVTPNAVSTILGVFSYYFINAMVTISAVLFLAGARTMVITTKIKQLQYYNKYNEIFVMSLLLLLTNIVFKVALQWMAKRKEEKVHQESPERKHVDYAKAAKTASIRKTIGVVVSAICILCVAGFGMGGRNSDLVVIYSNADDEAITTMKETLDKNGYQGKYILQSFGTSELGGKLMAEGNKIEADLITMSTFYIESAQEQNQMFTDLTFEHHTLSEFPSYCTPITAQEGAIILNTRVMESQNLPVPTSLKDLTNPIYAVQINVFKEYQDFRSLLLREKN